ncbi:MAG: hypothetical protein GX649_15175 [Chloroflexi bacterium]|nr:hypothetical protein [Chloroflexota bacterium]
MADWWDGKPWRMIQTNLREIDMVDIDADRVVADLQDFKANAILFNMAGIIASYPTSLPFHFQSPYLQGSSLAEIIDACHAADIRILARTDFSKIRRPIYEEHPDWAYRTRDGDIVDYNGDVHACINGGYQQEYALEIIRELLTQYDIDGIFFNMGGYQTRDYSGNYYGPCHCANCQRRFAEATGLRIPAQEDMGDPVFRKFQLFRRETAAAHSAKVYDFIQSIRPDIAICNHLAAHRGLIRMESNTAVDRPLPHWQYTASANAKWATSSYPEMIASITTVDFIDIPYRHVAVSPEQQRLRLAQNLANGGAVDLYQIGRLDNHEDKSGYAPVKEMFHYHAAHEEDYVHLRSQANIALLNGPDANMAEFRGWFRFLLENHFLFDTLMTSRALELPWDRYQAIIVPDYEVIDDALAARIDRFVAEGGTLIAVGRAGWRGADLELRDVPALSSLGLLGRGDLREEMRSAMFKMEDKAGFRRFPVTDVLYLDGPYIYGQYADDVERHLRLIPPHMFGPPERCYYTQVTEQPGFTVRKVGQGQAIYVPWLPGTLFHRQGHTNTIDWAGDLLESFAGLAPVGGNLSPMVEVTLFRQETSGNLLLQFVNTSGHFGNTFYAPVPMEGIEVTVPGLAPPRAVTSLASGEACAFRHGDDGLIIEVPRLELLQALRIEY